MVLHAKLYDMQSTIVEPFLLPIVLSIIVSDSDALNIMLLTGVDTGFDMFVFRICRNLFTHWL